jgi:hypothetical protein
MTDEKKEIKIEFTNSFLKSLEEITKSMTPEEQAEFEKEFQEIIGRMREGDFSDGEPIDMKKLAEEDPELYRQIIEASEEETEVSNKN